MLQSTLAGDPVAVPESARKDLTESLLQFDKLVQQGQAAGYVASPAQNGTRPVSEVVKPPSPAPQPAKVGLGVPAKTGAGPLRTRSPGPAPAPTPTAQSRPMSVQEPVVLRPKTPESTPVQPPRPSIQVPPSATQAAVAPSAPAVQQDLVIPPRPSIQAASSPPRAASPAQVQQPVTLDTPFVPSPSPEPMPVSSPEPTKVQPRPVSIAQSSSVPVIEATEQAHPIPIRPNPIATQERVPTSLSPNSSAAVPIPGTESTSTLSPRSPPQATSPPFSTSPGDSQRVHSSHRARGPLPAPQRNSTQTSPPQAPTGNTLETASPSDLDDSMLDDILGMLEGVRFSNKLPASPIKPDQPSSPQSTSPDADQAKRSSGQLVSDQSQEGREMRKSGKVLALPARTAARVQTATTRIGISEPVRAPLPASPLATSILKAAAEQRANLDDSTLEELWVFNDSKSPGDLVQQAIIQRRNSFNFAHEVVLPKITIQVVVPRKSTAFSRLPFLLRLSCRSVSNF